MARSIRPPIPKVTARINDVPAAVSTVPEKNSRRVTLIAWENGKVRFIACTPTTRKYQSGACVPPLYIGCSTGPGTVNRMIP